MATKTVIMLGTSHRHPNDKGHYGKVFAKLEFNDDPKFKDTLPLYDTFPLVLPLEPIKGGFLGMNFHYLPYMARFRMLERLQAFASNKKFDRTTRLNLGYDDIKNSNLFKPTIKKYLYAYTRSNYLRIDADEAAISIMLPVQQFKKGRPY